MQPGSMANFVSHLKNWVAEGVASEVNDSNTQWVHLEPGSLTLFFDRLLEANIQDLNANELESELEKKDIKRPFISITSKLRQPT